MSSKIFELEQSQPTTTELKAQIDLLLRVARRLAETDIPAALSLTVKAIDQATRGDWDRQPLDHQLAQCFHLQGRLLLNQAEYRAGLICFSKAQSLYDALDDQSGSAVELYYIGVAQAFVGLYADALRNMGEALVVFEGIADHPMMSPGLNGIGCTYVLLNEPGKALPYLLESERIARQTGVKIDLVNTLDSLGKAHLALGEHDAAFQRSAESVRLSREVGALLKEAEYLLGLGSIHLALQEIGEAENCFRESLALARRHQYRFAEAGALRRLGQLRKLKGQTRAAIEYISEALALIQQIGSRQELFLCYQDLADVYKEAGDFAAALDFYEQYHRSKEAVFTEHTEFRVKSLEISYELKEATKEKEIYYLKNVALQREIEERQRAQTRAEQLAIIDSLTGLFNRRHLFFLTERQLSEAIRYRLPLSLVMFDLDHFKKINDELGHAAGDKVLTAVSAHVQSVLRRSDFVGRYGGEEFVVVLPQTNAESAMVLAERLRQEVAELTIELNNDRRIQVTISAGVAGLPFATEENRVEQLMDWADRALYAAKKDGRNRCAFYQQNPPDPTQIMEKQR